MNNSNNIDKIQFKNVVRLLVGGYIYDGGNVEEVTEIIRETADDYEKIVEEVKETLLIHKF